MVNSGNLGINIPMIQWITMVDVKKSSGDWLLIAHGEPISSSKLIELAKHKSVMVLDGAYPYAKSNGLTIDILLGDFDSISSDDLKNIPKLIHVVPAPDQNKTDLEKGLDHLDQLHASSIYICAATGKRLQHTINNLLILKKYHRKHRSLILVTDNETVRYFHDTSISLSGQINEGIALLGFPYGRITTTGLKYDVTNHLLEFEKNNSISNALAKSEAHIRIEGNVLLIHEHL